MSFEAVKNDSAAPVSADSVTANAIIDVYVSDSGLLASVRMTPPTGDGKGPTFDLLREALTRCGVNVNIDLPTLKNLESNPVYDQDIIVARGVAPQNGADGTATLLVQTENKGRPKEIENGRVDYYDLGLIDNVQAGEALCSLTPPTEGSPGTSVRGEVLRQRGGKPAPIVPGPNTELNADGTLIVAKIAGQFEYDGKKVCVSETYTVNSDVDTSTGNIKVAGNLVIRGKVNTGFTVEAGGFINVVGVVESATITAGKDLNLQGGAKGATITCDGNLRARFIENSSVFARGDIRAEYIMSSNVRCKKSLKTEGVISKIIGGTCIVLQGIECRTIGSAAGIKTKLEIGNDPELIERQRNLNELIPELEKQMKSLEPLLKLLRQLEATNRLDEEKKITLEKASYSYSTHSVMLENAKKELADITDAIYSKNYSKIVCTGIVYPGTVITIGSANYNVTANQINTSFYYKEGEVSLGSAR